MVIVNIEHSEQGERHASDATIGGVRRHSQVDVRDLSTLIVLLRPGVAQDEAEVAITLPFCPVTQIGQHTRDPVSYCLCCFFLHPFQPISQNGPADGEGPPPCLPSSGRWGGISSVLSNLGNQAG